MTEIEPFISFISKKYNIDNETLLLDWKKHLAFSTCKKKEYKKCVYEFMRPPHTGKVCGASIRKEGASYCSKHAPYELREILKKENGDDKEDKNIKKYEEKEIEKPKLNKLIAIRLHPILKKFVHSSGLVFFSKQEKVVYGKLVDEEIVELNDEDIEICRKYSFKYDTSKFNS